MSKLQLSQFSLARSAKAATLSACLTVCVMIVSMPPQAVAQGHLQTWNIASREKSRKLTSAALNALNKGALEIAASLLVQATDTDPTDPLPLETLGMTYLRQGKSSQALNELQKAYKLIRDPETLLSTGFAYYLEHDYDAAITSWTKALELARGGQGMIEAEGDIGFAYLRKGDFPKADEHFRELITARPNSQLAYHGLAVMNYLAGNFGAARKAAEHAQSIQAYFPLLLLLAKLDLLQGDAPSAQKRVSEWQSLSTSKRTLQRSMTALGYPSQHDFHWDPFIVDNFDTGRLLLARAQAATVKSDTKRAEVKRKALAMASKKKSTLDPMQHAQLAHDSYPQDYYVLHELALVETAYGEYAQAADHFREVLRLCPACSVDWLHLARALSAQGKSGEAAYAIHEFQRTHPGQRLSPVFTDLAKSGTSNTPEPGVGVTSGTEIVPPKPLGPKEPGF